VLPDLRAKISQQLVHYDRELKTLGAPLDDGSPNKGALLLHLLTKFCQDFRAAIDGNGHSLADISTTELCVYSLSYTLSLCADYPRLLSSVVVAVFRRSDQLVPV